MIGPQSDISCIILAGGAGKRFNNQDKGLVMLNNKPLIEHVMQSVEAQVDDIVISANRNIETYKKYSPLVIKDSNEDFCGPLAGIASAIPHCTHDWALVVPCDMPLLPANLAEQLIKKINNRALAIVESNDRLQLVLLIHISLLSGIQQALSQQQHKLMDWVKLQNHVVVHFQEDVAFSNINSIEQLSIIK